MRADSAVHADSSVQSILFSPSLAPFSFCANHRIISPGCIKVSANNRYFQASMKTCFLFTLTSSPNSFRYSQLPFLTPLASQSKRTAHHPGSPTVNKMYSLNMFQSHIQSKVNTDIVNPIQTVIL